MKPFNRIPAIGAVAVIILLAFGCADDTLPTAALEPSSVEAPKQVFAENLSEVELGKGGAVAAVSGAWILPGQRVLAFNARLMADGSATGSWQRVEGLFGPNHGVVECMVVEGNQVWIGTRGTVGTTAGFLAGFRVVDNGKKNDGEPDQVSLHFLNLGDDGAQAYCNSKLDAPTLFDVHAGSVNLRVQ